MNRELKPCPFCGGDKLKIDSKTKLFGFNGLEDRIEYHTFSVRCNKCHARGGAIGGKVNTAKRKGFEKFFTTDYELKQKAIVFWNKRADNPELLNAEDSL